MRVLQIANGYLGNKLYQNMFEHLHDIDVQNLVYVPIDRHVDIPEVVPNDVYISQCFSQIDRALFFRKQRRILKDISTHYDLNTVDVIHAHTVFSGGYAAYQLYKRYGKPYLIAVRNTDKNVFFRYMVYLRKIGVSIMEHAERIIFLSPQYRSSVIETYIPEYLKSAIYNKSLIIPNGIHDYFLENLGKPRLVPNKPLRLIYVGEVSSNKNIEMTLKAAEILRSKGIMCEIVVAGKILEDKYRFISEGSPFISYLGQLSKEQVLCALREADIFIMPSHTETFGLVYAEAMSQGVPVIYTRGQGFDGQFPEGTVGYAVSDHDPEDIVRRIFDIIDKYSEISNQCVQHVSRFNWSTIAMQYKDIYNKIVKVGK